MSEDGAAKVRFEFAIRDDKQWVIERGQGWRRDHGPFESYGEAKDYIKRLCVQPAAEPR